MSETIQYQAEYEYSTSLARRAYWVTLIHDYWPVVIFSYLCLAVGIWELCPPGNSLISGIFFGIVFTVWLAWSLGLCGAGRASRSAPDRRMRLTLTDEACQIQSCFITATVRWEGIKRAYHWRGVLLLHRRDTSAYTPIPVTALPPEALEFVLRKVRQSGGKVC